MKFIKLMNAILLGMFFLSGCNENPTITSFKDDFNRADISRPWFDTIGRYLIIKGELNITGAYNHPLWLKKRIGPNVDIEFDAKSNTADGDVKIELFGDGKSFAHNKGAYVATGYVFCLGGWKNTKTFIARRFEHAKNLLHTRKVLAKKGVYQHWKISSTLKDGTLTLSWYIDGVHVLTLKDSASLYKSGNEYFAFSNWASDSWFDNLKIVRTDNSR
ncbi:MAG: hypothetical protein JXR95_13520 [Deltaproteobacteria bacterium]|nr:hypothetical protein [Deltaproteobacteria bacterium]